MRLINTVVALHSPEVSIIGNRQRRLEVRRALKVVELLHQLPKLHYFTDLIVALAVPAHPVRSSEAFESHHYGSLKITGAMFLICAGLYPFIDRVDSEVRSSGSEH
jgi:hypothetical protein